MSAVPATSRLSAHFLKAELQCRCCGEVHLVNAMKTANELEKIRELVGPLVVCSGHRCEQNNIRVGGKWNSQHLVSLAADVLIPSDIERYRLVAAAIASGVPGIGVGPNYVHLDWRPSGMKVMWSYPDRG